MNFAEICAVNEEINDCREYTSHVDPLWEPINKDKDGGTCTNFAVAKFRRLEELGFPTDALRLACCWVDPKRDPRTDYHAVLWVDYNGKSWELSNGMPVRDVRMSPWEYDRVQVANTREWSRPLL